jgi:histidine phosphotransferase ChpT
MTDSRTDAGLNLASLLCSRLCHDLLSPIGALNNGIELLADETDPGMRDQCITLLGDSARVSAAKLKFFRLAFGSAGGFGDSIPTFEAKAAIDGLFAAQGRIKTGWIISDPQIDKPAAKVMLNLAMIVGEALPRGGQLDIGLERRGKEIEIVVRGAGPRVILDPDLAKGLRGALREEELTSRTIAAWLVSRVARDHGGNVQLSDDTPGVLLCGASLKVS